MYYESGLSGFLKGCEAIVNQHVSLVDYLNYMENSLESGKITERLIYISKS